MSNFDFNVPFPEPKKYEKKERPDTYGLNNFPVGASKFVPAGQIKSQASNLHIIARKKNNGGNFKTRTVFENEIQGIRIWRIS